MEDGTDGASAAGFVSKAVEKTWPGQTVRLRTPGGGVPAGRFIDTFHVTAIGIALANHDYNQHSNNENARMGKIYDGIVTLAGVIGR